MVPNVLDAARKCQLESFYPDLEVCLDATSTLTKDLSYENLKSLLESYESFKNIMSNIVQECPRETGRSPDVLRDASPGSLKLSECHLKTV